VIRIPREKEDKTVKVVKSKEAGEDFEEDDDEGDQFLSVKPWKGAIK